MKAVVFREHGGPEVLHYQDVETPVPGPGEVLVKVHAVSLNRGPDTMVMQGGFGLKGIVLPHVSGTDPAGEIAALGEGVDSVSIGDRVVVYPILRCNKCDFCHAGAGENYCRNFRLIGVHTWGGQAEYIKVPAYNVVPLDPRVSYEAAATLGVSYLTAWHGMVAKANTVSGDTVLVMAASSGVGVAAIQIAKMLGARVIAASSADWKLDRARAIGADETVNYQHEHWGESVRELTGGFGVNVLFDNVGQETWAQSVRCLDRGGRLFCSGSTSDPNVHLDLRFLYRNMITMYFHMQGTRAELAELVSLVAEGKIRPIIDSRYALRDVALAQQKLADQGQFGKLVLTSDLA